jgi:YVTN family beta-propeller protein
MVAGVGVFLGPVLLGTEKVLFDNIALNWSLSIANTISPTDAKYTGPMWSIYGSNEFGLEFGAGGAIDSLLKLLGVSSPFTRGPSIKTTAPPFAQSPMLSATAAASADGCSVQLGASGLAKSTPVVKWLAFENGATTGGQTVASSSGATASWALNASNAGSYAIAAQSSDTFFGGIGLPYSSGATAKVTVNPTAACTSPGTSQIVPPVGTFRDGVEVFFKLVFTDPNNVATGFGFRANVAGAPESNYPFSSPSYGNVVLSPGGGTVEYPFNLGCGTTAEIQSSVVAWINDKDGQRSPSVIVPLACTAPLGTPSPGTPSPGNIYIANAANNTVTTYDAKGTQTTPTITQNMGVSEPIGVAVDAVGKIYVANSGNNTVTTYNANGSGPVLTITTGLSSPHGVAVDAAGKIYVANSGNNTVTTYNSDGTPSNVTITGLPTGGPFDMAVDAAGKIYVANFGNDTMTTYNADGTPTIPTITGLGSPAGVAVDAAGKIYVSNLTNNNVTIYTASGAPTTPTTITTGLSRPYGLAVDAVGKIYVANNGNNTLTIYNAAGMLTNTITLGLNFPTGVAVH